MNNEKILAHVRMFVLREKLLCPGEPLHLAAAVSGGADSMALLRILLALQPEFGFVLSACHVNHGLATGFKKDYKRAIKRGLKIELLEQVVALLAMGEPLPEKNRDHDLSGDWVGHRECHILPDWLLIYRIEDDVLVLTLARTGSHSDLFGK